MYFMICCTKQCPCCHVSSQGSPYGKFSCNCCDCILLKWLVLRVCKNITIFNVKQSQRLWYSTFFGKKMRMVNIYPAILIMTSQLANNTYIIQSNLCHQSPIYVARNFCCDYPPHTVSQMETFYLSHRPCNEHMTVPYHNLLESAMTYSACLFSFTA